jgi:hypothetical protein
VSFFPSDQPEIDAVRQSRIGEAAQDEFGSDPGGIAADESEDGARRHAQ